MCSFGLDKKNDKYVYYLITFNKRLVQLFDTDYLYNMSLKELSFCKILKIYTNN